MFITEIKRALPYLFEADIAPLIVGHHGQGKTESVKQFAADNNYLIKTINLGTLADAGDLIGLADFETDSQGNKVSTRFITPDWVKDVIKYAIENPNSKAIIYLDEINRARRDILQAVFSLVLEKRIHMIQMPKNVFVVAAMNPNTEDYIVTDISDKAFLDRFCHIKFTPSVNEWLEYSEANGMERGILSFIKEQPNMLSGKTEDFSLNDISPSRRSMQAVNRLMKSGAPNDLLRELTIGLIGTEATIALERHLASNDNKPIKAVEILNNYELVRQKVLDFSSDKESARFDLLNDTCNNLVEELKEVEKLKKAQLKNFKQFMLEDLPNDVFLSFIQKLVNYKMFSEHFIKDVDLASKIKEVKEIKKGGK